MPKGYSQKISDAEVILAGIKSNKDTLISRGIDDEYIEKFAELTESCVETNNNQDSEEENSLNNYPGPTN